ncbi:hypothetical protein [Photorhabdus khanii]|uniref:Uncharacterized protein n=1 Tax=Photorhabdus khanii subsp. guanajuatensis TaxID=2100166 RepID=A0A4R4J608_9GAMM|nr:hypothetical protein [Photorhabdus khanii]TDB49023.1 hypothetical protein C5467_18010 [Photorhabdus khanii subsp. guanajuatensis]
MHFGMARASERFVSESLFTDCVHIPVSARVCALNLLTRMAYANDANGIGSYTVLPGTVPPEKI